MILALLFARRRAFSDGKRLQVPDGDRAAAARRPRNERILGRDAMADMFAYARDPRDSSTPNAMIDLLRLFYLRKDKLSPSSHDLMMKIMEASPTGRTASAKPCRREASHCHRHFHEGVEDERRGSGRTDSRGGAFGV